MMVRILFNYGLPVASPVSACRSLRKNLRSFQTTGCLLNTVVANLAVLFGFWPGINYVFSKRAFLFIELIVLEYLCSWTMSAFLTIGNLTKQVISHSNIFCQKFAFKIFWGWKLLPYWWWWPSIAKRFVCGSESYQGQVKTRQKETFDKVSLLEQSVSEDTILWPLVQKRSCR